MLAFRVAMAAVLLVVAAGLAVREWRFAHHPDMSVAAHPLMQRNRLLKVGVMLAVIFMAEALLARL